MPAGELSVDLFVHAQLKMGSMFNWLIFRPSYCLFININRAQVAGVTRQSARNKPDVLCLSLFLLALSHYLDIARDSVGEGNLMTEVSTWTVSLFDAKYI